MATRIRDGPPGKERTGISPTILHPADPTRRRSPNTSPSSPAGSADQKHESASSGKRIPNYLKPTKCSSSSSGLDHHSLHHAKKAASPSDAAHKPTLTRRRSFDRPPAPQVSKTRVSAAQKPTLTRRRSFDMPPPSQVPKTRSSPAPKERTPQSSSSSSAKSTMIRSQKGLSDSLSKAPKDAGEKKSSSPRPVSLKRSSNGAKKQDHGTSLVKTITSITTSSDRADNPEIAEISQPQEEDPQPLITDEEVTINALSNHEMPDEIEEVEDNKNKKHIDPIQAEPDIQEHENITTIESSQVAVDQDAPGVVKMEEPEDQNSLAEETRSNILESEQHFANDSIDPTNESLASEPTAEDQEKGAVEDANDASDKEGGIEDGSDAVNSKETEEVKDASQEAKQEAQNVAAKRQLPVRAKQESAVSNAVIEETASKLREQRKNKVKALAGAFETVISLQESK